MKKYIEITLLPEAEISISFLWEKLYQQLHLAFVEIADANGIIKVGVSFPRYQWDDQKNHLGNKLRLFAPTEPDLAALQLAKWLGRLRDYIHIRSVQDVPDRLEGYASFRRLNDKDNKMKLARRRAKRLSIADTEALAYFTRNPERKQPQRQVKDYPFISITSLSSGNKYPITIVRENADALVTGFGFNTYGLSVDRAGSKQYSSVPTFK